MAKLTKKAKALAAAVDREKLHGVDEALGLIKTHATAKFDESVEIAINLGVDPRHADQMVRGVVTLPAGTGKDVRVAVFARGDNAEKATAAGADKVGAEDLMEDMQNGNLDYDRVIATPEGDALAAVNDLSVSEGPATASSAGVRPAAAGAQASRLAEGEGLKEAMARIERDILASLCGELGSSYAIAERLGISQPSVVRKMQRHGLRIRSATER